jgi:hypothetical protein
MAALGDELDDWDEFDEEERERLRALLVDLGLELDSPEDPDEFE